MSADPPVPAPERFRHWITEVEVSPWNTDPNCKFSARIFLDDELVSNLPSIDHTRSLRWSGLLLCDVSALSTVALRLCRRVGDKPRYFNFPSIIVSEADETGESVLELPEAAWVVIVRSLTPTMAEQLFPKALDHYHTIEGVYNSLKPNQTAKYLFKSALQFAAFVAEAIPDSGAKVSFLIEMKAWDLLNQQTQLDDTIQAVLRGLTYIRDVVDVASQASGSILTAAVGRAKGTINGILAFLEDVSVYIFNRCTSNELMHIPSEGARPGDKYDVEAYLVNIRELQNAFYASWSQPATFELGAVNLIQDESVDHPSLNDQITDEPTNGPDPYEMLSLLKPMKPTGFDPDQACMDGTRDAILNRIITWSQNRGNSESFLWISGPIGMGKTSVATSLCQRLYDIRALAGSFFCQSDDPESGSPLRLTNNLIHLMALRIVPYAHEVASAIRVDRSLCTAHLSQRYKYLIKKPLERLKHLSMPMTLVVVVDGLDACGNLDSRETILHKLYGMSQLVPWLKIIISARPVVEIQDFFHNFCPQEPIIRLQNYDAGVDIRAYIEIQLGKLAEKGRWAPGTFDKLCAMSQGVFLWAALATKYIKKPTFPASPRLHKMLDNRKSPVTDQFDALYTRALETAIDDNEDDIKAVHLQCIGALLATSERDELAIQDLQSLLLVTGQVDQLTLEQILKNLAPLLLILDDERIRFLHPSFRDFVSIPSRSGEFHIRLDECDYQPTASCLKLMQRDLRFNICELKTSHLFNSQVPDLKLRIESHIGPALKYACIHWIDHFISSPSQLLVETIKEFWDGPQLMYWIEVLSLLGRLDVAISGLSKLMSLELNQWDSWGYVLSWAKDIHRFLLSFFDAISASTPHLYISALAFIPSKSLMAQRMRPYFPNTVTVAQGPSSAWHPCIRTTYHPHAVQSLSLSPDGLNIAVGYSDGSLAVWDLKTGSRLGEIFMGHKESVTCVVYSPNGGLIATSSYDTTVRVWEVAGRNRTSHSLSGHSGPVHAVAFSPNASIIASGSSDKTIRLWDVKAMRPAHGGYICHSSRVSALAFSSDGTRLVSGSWDKTIRVWLISPGGQKLAEAPLVAITHSDPVTCVSLSPDGSMIASGSVEGAIRLWTSPTGGEARSCTPHSGTVTSIAFSSNGNRVISSSLDGWIKLYDTATLETVIHPFGHSNLVNAVSLSPTGTYIVSGSTDMTTRLWDIGACPKLMTTPSLLGHTDYVFSVAVSSDGTHIVSGARDNTLRLWDTNTGAPVGNPFNGHSGRVNCVAISRDGIHIVSASEDKTIKLWDTATRTPLNSHQHSRSIRSVAFSSSGSRIAFGTDDENVYLWEVARWKAVKGALKGHTKAVNSVAFSPDGNLIASASEDAKVIFWDIQAHTRSGKPALAHPGVVTSVAFSPCGKKLVSGCGDHRVRIWDIVTGNLLRELKGHSDWARSVAYAPDGSCIASGSDDNTIRLWIANTGQLLQPPLAKHSDYVRSVAFFPNSNQIISGSDDKTIRVWNLDTPPIGTQMTTPPEAFRWPTSPYELSPHPHHPGWVIDDQESLVFWLPHHYQQPEHFPRIRPEVPCPRTCLDYSKFVHGTAWTVVASNHTTSSSG